jgi:tRNA-2-methylthio-N6-dimethylallyladenosine synthase
MINSVRGNRSPVVDISFPEIEKFDRLPEPRAEGPTAFVSIMEGCNKYCTYCVVPYTRGEEVSRPCDDILFEIAQLAAQGVREVNLLGQNVNAWRGENYDGSTGSLPICCVWWRRLTVSTAFALPPATRSNLPTISLMSIAIRRSW